jgi:hypothetical protein
MTTQARLAATLARQRPEPLRPMPRDVCPHCQRATTIHGFTAPDGHWLETHHCAEHGDVCPMRSSITTNEGSTMPILIENPRAFRDPAAARDRRLRGAREEFAAWRDAHPNFTNQELLDHWKRIRRAWNLSPPEPKPRKKTP